MNTTRRRSTARPSARRRAPPRSTRSTRGTPATAPRRAEQSATGTREERRTAPLAILVLPLLPVVGRGERLGIAFVVALRVGCRRDGERSILAEEEELERLRGAGWPPLLRVAILHPAAGIDEEDAVIGDSHDQP